MDAYRYARSDRPVSIVPVRDVPAVLILAASSCCSAPLARDHQLLGQTAEEDLLARPDGRVLGQPIGDFLAPQIEREGFKLCQQGVPEIAQRMPPARQRVIDDDDLAAGLDHTEHFAQRALAPWPRLLMQQEENQTIFVAGVGQ